ncbi:MAG TPA: hypothetical protein VGH73_08425 [Thermoanaerobaculia bacterium]|jgi:hypothetical protein
MAVVIDETLTAAPAEVGLPSGPIVLRQTVHSDLGGEPAEITYSLDGRHNVAFQTPQGPAKQVQVSATIPGGETERADTVSLMLDGAGTALGQVIIKQLIQAETKVHDSVTVSIKI